MKLSDTLYVDKSTVDNAVRLWQTGQLVAFATETVYGLGANANNNGLFCGHFVVKMGAYYVDICGIWTDMALLNNYYNQIN